MPETNFEHLLKLEKEQSARLLEALRAESSRHNETFRAWQNERVMGYAESMQKEGEDFYGWIKEELERVFEDYPMRDDPDDDEVLGLKQISTGRSDVSGKIRYRSATEQEIVLHKALRSILFRINSYFSEPKE
jgi:hypothetical protein